MRGRCAAGPSLLLRPPSVPPPPPRSTTPPTQLLAVSVTEPGRETQLAGREAREQSDITRLSSISPPQPGGVAVADTALGVGMPARCCGVSPAMAATPPRPRWLLCGEGVAVRSLVLLPRLLVMLFSAQLPVSLPASGSASAQVMVPLSSLLRSLLLPTSSCRS